MTTITWDLKSLSADTLVSIDAASLTGIHLAPNWENNPKLFAPTKRVTFENSPIIAIGAAGNVGAGNRLVKWLLDGERDDDVYKRPAAPLCNDLIQHALEVQKVIVQPAWLFVLTDTHCWQVTSKIGVTPTVDDVTRIPSAIGSGAKYARPCLTAGKDGVDAIHAAAIHHDAETNFTVDYVKHKPGAQIKRALRSLTTFRNPVRNNQLINCSIAAMGTLLTAGGVVGLQASGHEEPLRLMWAVCCMFGIVLANWSILNSGTKLSNLGYSLGIPVVLMLSLPIPVTGAFIQAHNLQGPIFLSIIAVSLLELLKRGRSLNSFSALHYGSGLAVGGVLAAVTLFSDGPHDWPSAMAGLIGVAAGHLTVWVAVRYMLGKIDQFRVLFYR